MRGSAVVVGDETVEIEIEVCDDDDGVVGEVGKPQPDSCQTVVQFLTLLSSSWLRSGGPYG